MLTEDTENVNRLKPQPYVLELLNYKTSGKLLDVGAGWGRNSLFLAKAGFQVTSLEPDADELATLKANIAEQGLAITALPTDLSTIDFENQFDVVVCTMVLHFLASSEEIVDAIGKLKKATTKNGVHIVSVLHENTYVRRTHLFKPGELKSYYSDWKTLDHVEGPGPSIPEQEGRRFARSILITQKP